MRIKHMYQGCGNALPQRLKCKNKLTCAKLGTTSGCKKKLGQLQKNCITNLKAFEKKKKVKEYCRQKCGECGKLTFYI